MKKKKIAYGLSEEKDVIPLDFQGNMEQFLLCSGLTSLKKKKKGVSQHGLLV